MADNKQEKKLCGFDKEPCIQDKCAHWAEVIQATQLGAPKRVGVSSRQFCSLPEALNQYCNKYL